MSSSDQEISDTRNKSTKLATKNPIVVEGEDETGSWADTDRGDHHGCDPPCLLGDRPVNPGPSSASGPSQAKQ